MEVLVLDGKDYVKASKAARDLGYATDYVGQLCRTGQIDAHLIGRTWYVNKDELSTHKVEKKRISRAKAREYAKKTIEEYRQKATQNEKTTKNIAIQYETDTDELIPTVRKLSVESEIREKKKADLGNLEKADDLLVEHEGERIVMQGSLDVVDVTDGVIDEHTTLLTPKIIRKRREPEAELETETEVPEAQPEKPNFLSRLEEVGITEVSEMVVPSKEGDEQVQEVAESTLRDPELEEVVVVERPEPQPVEQGSILWYIFVLSVVLLLTVSTIFISNFIGYDALKNPQVTERVEFSYTKTINILKLKI